MFKFNNHKDIGSKVTLKNDKAVKELATCDKRKDLRK